MARNNGTIELPRWVVITGGAIILGGGLVLAIGTVIGGFVLRRSAQTMMEEAYRQGVIKGMEACSVYVEREGMAPQTGQTAAVQTPQLFDEEAEKARLAEEIRSRKEGAT